LAIVLLKSCSSAELLSSSDSKIKIRKKLKKEKKFGLIIEFGGRFTAFSLFIQIIFNASVTFS